MTEERKWRPERHGVFFRLERIVRQDWAGTGLSYLKYPHGGVRLFWTRRQAQREADILNRENGYGTEDSSL